MTGAQAPTGDSTSTTDRDLAENTTEAERAELRLEAARVTLGLTRAKAAKAVREAERLLAVAGLKLELARLNASDSMRRYAAMPEAERSELRAEAVRLVDARQVRGKLERELALAAEIVAMVAP